MPIEVPKVPTGLNEFVGNRETVDVLQRAISQHRLPHALIFAGPPGVGKCTLAILLAQRLNCLASVSGAACGVCSMCRKILAVLRSRYSRCLSPRGQVPCGGCQNCRVMADQHPDVRLITPERTTIGIDQVRDLIAEISYQPFEARYRVVILDPADQMRAEAHNSLLKTLEEPPSRTIIVLVTASPYLLLQTIRSRSRLLNFGAIPQRLIEEYIAGVKGLTAAEARLAAIFSHGSLASALAFDNGRFREARELALRFARILLKRGRFFEASEIAAALAKDKDIFDPWLESVEAILRDVYFTQIMPARVSQQDLGAELSDLAQAATKDTIASGIDAFRKFRRALKGNANRQIALESLFLSVAS